MDTNPFYSLNCYFFSPQEIDPSPLGVQYQYSQMRCNEGTTTPWAQTASSTAIQLYATVFSSALIVFLIALFAILFFLKK